MYAEPLTIDRPAQLSTWLPAPARDPRPPAPTLHRERAWRVHSPSHGGNIVASRWSDDRTAARHERGPLADHTVLAVSLRPARLRLGDGRGTAFEGTMPSGMVHVTGPGQQIEAEFFTPCDFVHFHVATAYLQDRQAAAAARPQDGSASPAPTPSLDGLLIRDELAAQLARTLTDDLEGGDPLYAESIGQTILMRVLAYRPAAARVGALPKWRLRRVQEHLAANIAEPISLSDLAEAAGLSRMHFAAQFRAATGCRPHDYLLQHRVEHAKQMLTGTDTPLVEVALSTGFQTQSHFSTVFKRLVGETPARWQRMQRPA